MYQQRTTLTRRTAPDRRGAIAVLAALMSVVLIGMVAFAVDVGYVLSAKQELQRAADAAAMAACWEYSRQLAYGSEPADAEAHARSIAESYAAANIVAGQAPLVDTNVSNSPDGDVVFGYIGNVLGPYTSLNTSSSQGFNAVKVRIRRDGTINDEIPYFFARVFGQTGQSVAAEATAAYVQNISGFRTPADGGNIDILPFALDLDTWMDLLNGSTSDDYSWDEDAQQISSGPDGILEVNLYPQGTGSPGNRGTVDIGSNNNSTSDISRQILDGISTEDLDYHGGVLELDSNGELGLNGDTGISAGVKNELNAVKGQPRVIPIFSQVSGPGNNAEYTVVRWAGIRIMYVKLTGSMSKKRVIIQPSPMVASGVIPAPSEGTSDYVYSPVVLVH